MREVTHPPDHPAGTSHVLLLLEAVVFEGRPLRRTPSLGAMLLATELENLHPTPGAT